MNAMKTKYRNIVLPLGLFILFAGFLSSCGPDWGNNHHFHVNTSQYAQLYMPQARPDSNDVNIVVIDSTQYKIHYSAVYAGAAKAPTDIQVTFQVNPALVDSFNARYIHSYPILPKDSYKMNTTSATIPAGGTHTPLFKIGITPVGHLKVGETYVLPITMTVKSGGVKVNKDALTAYYRISASLRMINKANWKVIAYDSYSTDGAGYPPSNIIDDNDASFWNTAYKTDTQSTAPLPHYAVIDMGKSHTIIGFKLVGRSGSLSFEYNQNPKKITMKLGDDGKNWKFSEDFTLPFSASVHKTKISLSKPVTARYFKFIVTQNVGGSSAPVTNFNEIYAF
jgi:hypothetical protein